MARPAELARLNNINIATAVDNTKIELTFNGKPGPEKVQYRDDFVQVEFPETYTDPAKQWLNVEDGIVKNLFVYQFDANTVRVRLFTYDGAVHLKGRIRISRGNNGLIIRYEQKAAVVNKKPPVTAKLKAKNELKKSIVPPVEIQLPETTGSVSAPAETESPAGSADAAHDAAENHVESPAEPLPAEPGALLHTPENLPVKQDAGEDKPALLKEPPGFTGSIIKMVTALGIVLSLLFAVVYFVKKYLGKKIGLGGQEQKIRVVTSTYLGPKKSIALVEVAGEKIVVGITATNISMLTKVGRDEDFGEVFKEQIKPEAKDEKVELQDELWEKV